MLELVSKYGLPGVLGAIAVTILLTLAKRATNALWDAAVRRPAVAQIYGCRIAQGALFIAGMLLFAGHRAATDGDIRHAFLLGFVITVIGYFPDMQIADKTVDVLKAITHQIELVYKYAQELRASSTK